MPQRRLGALAIAGLSLAVVSVLGIVVGVGALRRGRPPWRPDAVYRTDSRGVHPGHRDHEHADSRLVGVEFRPRSRPSRAAVSTVSAVPRVAFRRSGALWVADEDGRHIRIVRRSPDGPFAMSRTAPPSRSSTGRAVRSSSST